MITKIVLKLTYLTLSIGIIYLLNGCVYEEITPKEIIVPDSVSFATDIIPIFDTNCNTAGCHSTNSITPDLTAANAWISLTFFGYVETSNPESSQIYQKLTTGSMKGRATDQQIALILKWIEQGALND